MRIQTRRVFYSRRVENLLSYPTIGVLTNDCIVGGDTNNGVAQTRWVFYSRRVENLLSYPAIDVLTNGCIVGGDTNNGVCKRERLQRRIPLFQAFPLFQASTLENRLKVSVKTVSVDAYSGERILSMPRCHAQNAR